MATYYVIKPSPKQLIKDSLATILSNKIARGFIGGVERVNKCTGIILTDGVDTYAADIVSVARTPNTTDRVDVEFDRAQPFSHGKIAAITWSSRNVRYVDI